ncbi:hypothetical protein DIPPA_07756 [Diplonema papillatum]|nr:hypothetical protein DIPPA_07756 [Diplonema papillatum]
MLGSGHSGNVPMAWTPGGGGKKEKGMLSSRCPNTPASGGKVARGTPGAGSTRRRGHTPATPLTGGSVDVFVDDYRGTNGHPLDANERALEAARRAASEYIADIEYHGVPYVEQLRPVEAVVMCSPVLGFYEPSVWMQPLDIEFNL